MTPEDDQNRIESHTAWMRDLALRLTRDPNKADDLVQEVWLAYVIANPSPDRNRGLRPWLERVMRNAACTQWRKDRVRSHAGRLSEIDDLALEEANHASGHDDLSRLMTAIEQLKDPRAEILRMRFYEDLSTAEIAEQSGMPASTVRTHLHRGLEELRSRMNVGTRKKRRGWTLGLGLARIRRRFGARTGALVPAAGLGLVAVVLTVAAQGRSVAEREPALDARADAPAAAERGHRLAAIRTPVQVAEDVPVARPTAVRLLSARTAEHMAGYSLRGAHGTYVSDEDGMVRIPATETSLVPFDHVDLASSRVLNHGRRVQAPLDRAGIAIEPPSEGTTLEVPAGPTYRVEFDSPSGLPAEAFLARLRNVPGGQSVDDRSVWQIAPMRGGRQGQRWVRFGDGLAPGAAAPGIEILARDGTWWGEAPVPLDPADPVEVILQPTGVVRGDVLDFPADQRAYVSVILLDADDTSRLLHSTALDEDGSFCMPCVLPGGYELRLHAPTDGTQRFAVDVRAGEITRVDIDAVGEPAQGAVTGVVSSQSGTFDESTLIFLLDESGSVLDLCRAKWTPASEGDVTAPFEFASVPSGPVRIEVMSLEGCVLQRGGDLGVRAPARGVQIELLDEADARDCAFEVRDAETGARITDFYLDVRLGDGSIRRFTSRGVRAHSEGAPGRPEHDWAFSTSGFSWNGFTHRAPLRGLAVGTPFRWRVCAAAYRSVLGDQGNLLMDDSGSATIQVRMSKEPAVAR